MKPKYTPDMKTILRETDPRRAKRDMEDALEGLQRVTPPMFFVGGTAGSEGEMAEAAGSTAPQVSAASPWAKDGAGAGVDKAALPSAMAPATIGAEEPPVTTRAAAAELEKAPKWSWKVIAGLVGLVLAVALVSMTALVGQMRDEARKATARAMVVPSAAATEDAVLNGTAAPRAAPSATAITSATVSQAPSVPPRKPPIKPRERHVDPPVAVPAVAPVEPPPPPKYFE